MTIDDVVARTNKLGLKCSHLPTDHLASASTALCCLPMYMVANVHAWTDASQFSIPLLDLPGSEQLREAFVIGKQEAAFQIDNEHQLVLRSLLGQARPCDLIIYEYALDTIKEFLGLSDGPLSDTIRTGIGKMTVAVAEASGQGLFGTGEKISPQERECIRLIDAQLDLSSCANAAVYLDPVLRPGPKASNPASSN